MLQPPLPCYFSNSPSKRHFWIPPAAYPYPYPRDGHASGIAIVRVWIMDSTISELGAECGAVWPCTFPREPCLPKTCYGTWNPSMYWRARHWWAERPLVSSHKCRNEPEVFVVGKAVGRVLYVPEAHLSLGLTWD